MKLTTLACLTLLAAGCGSKSDAEKFADSYCAEIAKCCAQAGLSGDGNVCHLLLSQGTYNASAGDACLAEVKSQVAAGTFCSNQDASPTCNAVFTSTPRTGNKKPGEACEVAGDCAPSNDGKVVCASHYIDGTWVNKCQVQMRGKAGDGPCLGTQDGDVFSSSGAGNETDVPASGYICDTADGLRCSSSGTCTALLAVGQACYYSSDCVRSAYCDSTDHCSSRVSAGAACKGQDDECVAGYYCPDTSPRACTSQLSLGAACTSDAMCSSGNCESSTCKPNLADAFGWAILCQ
jgi:hypothetical protein